MSTVGFVSCTLAQYNDLSSKNTADGVYGRY